MSSAEMVSDPRAVIGRMCDEGYGVACGSGVQDALIAYISGSTPPVELRVDRPGWHGSAFVLPDEVIQPPTVGGVTLARERVHLASTSGAEAAYNVAGSLDDWKRDIGAYCVGNSRLVLAVCAGFAGPLLRPTGNETGGIHLCGASSVGKSSALSVAGSVCGGGDGGYVRQWRATTNGLEGIAHSHNDGLLALDELSQMAGKEVSAAAYMIGNQAGKARARKDGSAAPTRNWVTMVLSSGEMSLSAHSIESGQKVKAGAEVRLLTVPADAKQGMGLFENIHSFDSPGDFSNHLKARSKATYGAPLRAFLRWLVANRESALKRVGELQELFGDAYVPKGASGEITRAAARFSLLAAAGELATQGGVTDWPAGEATKAAGACFSDWLEERGSVAGGDVEGGVRQALAFIEQNGSRFQTPHQSFVPRDRAGFTVTEGGFVRYYILRGVFEDLVCKGHNFRSVREELIRRGYMIPGEPKRPGQQKVVLPGLGRPRVYVMEIAEDTFVEAEPQIGVAA